MSQLLPSTTSHLPVKVLGQNRGCPGRVWCSKYHCRGTTSAYSCADGRQSGHCTKPVCNGVVVGDIVTQQFFNSIIGQARADCPGKRFYTRQAFLDALAWFPAFGTTGTDDDSRREIAAFFAHVTHETDHFCYIEEINGASHYYCNSSKTQWPCNPNKRYYGRGPLQLTWNYNYGLAGQSLGFDGLNAPETVSKDPVISFKTALWYWFNAGVHSIMTSGRGFGPTVRRIHGNVDSKGKHASSVRARIVYYKEFCKLYEVAPGDNISC